MLNNLAFPTDFTIICHGAKIKCHRIILAAESDFFNKMFESTMQEAQQGEVIIDCLGYDILQQFVDFTYSGRITLKWDTLKEILQACEYLQITNLKRECSAYMMKHLTIDNSIHLHTLATNFHVVDVKSSAQSMIMNKFIAVTRQELLKLPSADVDGLIREIPIAASLKLWAVIEWALVDKNERKAQLEELIKHIDLVKCPNAQLMFVIDTYGSDLLTPASKVYDAFKQEGRETTKATTLVVMDKDSNIKMRRLDTDEPLDWESLENLPANVNPSNSYSSWNICAVPNGFALFADNACHVYNANTKAWKKSTTVPTYICNADHMVNIAHMVYVLPSQRTGDDTMCMDVNTLQWTILPGFKGSATKVIAAKHLFIIGIWQEMLMQCYDTFKQEWADKTPPPVQFLDDITAVGKEDYLYLFGGRLSLSCCVYSVELDVWSQHNTAMVSEHFAGAAIVCNGKIYVSGGTDKTFSREVRDIIEVFDPENDTWEHLPFKLPQPMSKHTLLCY